MAKDSGNVICDGNINTAKIYAVHIKIKEIVEHHKIVNFEVAKTTQAIKENWVGDGLDEFESQYNILIKKIDDFGDTLQEIYNALVDSEAKYETSDNSLKQDFKKATEG